jgi:UDP-N-acetylglucosamine 1-carboxyvinyltransferase
MRVLLERLEEAAVPIEVGDDWVASRAYDPAALRLRPTDVTTLPFPGFPTDMQAQWMALMTLADGMSLITEQIYPDRYMHVAELMRMGAQIRRQGTTSIVQGGAAPLTGARVMASDLRASAALVLAGLVAKGTTEVHRVYHIDRGYERIDERLRQLGADIVRAEEDEGSGASEPAPERVRELADADALAIARAVLIPRPPARPRAEVGEDRA